MEPSLSLPRVVRKRDGQVVDFDLGKIIAAISGAWLEVRGSLDHEKIVELARRTQGLLQLDNDNLLTPSVERIQDAVELTLMRDGCLDVAKAFILFRHKRAEMRGKRTEPDPEAIAQYIHASKYARWREDLGRRELRDESVARVEDMHLRRFAHLGETFASDIRWAFDHVRAKKVLPSMRSMQFGGAAVEQSHARQYNCSFSLIDRVRAFQEAFYLLLCGCGVGYSVQFQHVEKLPPVAYQDENAEVVHHVVGDTIEGWADAGGALIEHTLAGRHVEFAYHQIRRKGSLLKTSGGRAPGHRPLREALERARKVILGAQGRRLRPIECHRILCHFADAVLAGGIRRSAMIALFSIDDGEMMYCKASPSWRKTEPWLERANNSVALLRGAFDEAQFRRIFNYTREFGEPGFVFLSSLDHGVNPCVPAGTKILTRDGYRDIDKLVGKTVDVWNGREWSTVRPAVTGYDQPMVRVHLDDGTSLDCTEAHKWCVMRGKWSRDAVEERVEAASLVTGDRLQRYEMPLVEGGCEMPEAYAHGFYCADGHDEDHQQVAWLYGEKRGLAKRLGGRYAGAYDAQADRQKIVFNAAMPPKYSVPENADVRSRMEWFAGLLDGDGTVVRNPNSVGLQVTSVDRDFLLRVRRMLTTLGVQAKVTLGREAGSRMMPDGRGGQASYGCKTLWRLLVNAPDTAKLVRGGLRTSRLKLDALAPQRDARRFVRVERVEQLPRAEVVYCFTEEKNHTGTFEGIVTGQCAEIGLDPRLRAGDTYATGWAFCNLSVVNCAACKTEDELMQAALAASWIGTLQAAYTDFPYLGPVSEAIARRDALIGVSLAGIQDNPTLALDPRVQQAMAREVMTGNLQFATLLGIELAARQTCVKPDGTGVLTLYGKDSKSVGSGIHRHWGEKIIRRVTAEEQEPIFQAFRAVNPHMCVRKPSGAWCIEFPIQVQDGAALMENQSAVEFLRDVQLTQQNWVSQGTFRESEVPGLRHNVSNTCPVRENEWDDVADYLWRHQDDFACVSFLPYDVTAIYDFAPFEPVRTPEQLRRWNDLVAGYKPVDYSLVREDEDATALKGELACVGGACDWKAA